MNELAEKEAIAEVHHALRRISRGLHKLQGRSDPWDNGDIRVNLSGLLWDDFGRYVRDLTYPSMPDDGPFLRTAMVVDRTRKRLFGVAVDIHDEPEWPKDQIELRITVR